MDGGGNITPSAQHYPSMQLSGRLDATRCQLRKKAKNPRWNQPPAHVDAVSILLLVLNERLQVVAAQAKHSCPVPSAQSTQKKKCHRRWAHFSAPDLFPLLQQIRSGMKVFTGNCGGRGCRPEAALDEATRPSANTPTRLRSIHSATFRQSRH